MVSTFVPPGARSRLVLPDEWASCNAAEHILELPAKRLCSSKAMTTMVVMGGDWSYTLNEYGVPAGQRYLLFTEGYRKKALRKRWLGWVLSIEFLLFATSHPAWMPNLVVCFIYAA